VQDKTEDLSLQDSSLIYGMYKYKRRTIPVLILIK
jgi:hypothetical protein